MDILRVGAEEFRRKLSDLLNRVGYGKDRVIVERHGTPVAVLVPYAVYQAFEKFMDSRGELHLPEGSLEAIASQFRAEMDYANVTYDDLSAGLREERLRTLREYYPEYYQEHQSELEQDAESQLA